MVARLDFPLRVRLNDEVHARPPEPLRTPSALSYIASLSEPASDPADEVALAADLVTRFGADAPRPGAKHCSATLGGLRLRWERHTEFARYAFIEPGVDHAPFVSVPAGQVPEDWLNRLQGRIIVAAHAWVIDSAKAPVDMDEISTAFFDGNTLVGSQVADGRAVVLTDFRIHDDGFSRFLVLNETMSEAQSGRVLQRLLEIETYRMMMLMALQVAQDMMPYLDQSELELANVGEALVSSGDDQELLERLTRLAAENQSRRVRSDFRFAAADAYHELVQTRIGELREARIPGLQTFEEFMVRRLSPAAKTCRAAAQRQHSLVRRMARATQLLSTRVDIERHAQNQALLESVDRRVRSQLRLQATVEGLSVAAITYYSVGLIGFLADGLPGIGVPVSREPIVAVSVPIVAALVFLGVRRVRRHIAKEDLS